MAQDPRPLPHRPARQEEADREGPLLEAFKTYHTTAELSTTTDPNLVFNLRAKLDAAGHYDDYEVDRVVAAELNPTAKQSDLVAALEPVSDRLLKRYKAASDQDQLVCVNGVLMGKMLESETLRQQATNNTKEQFAISPDLRQELDNAIIEALDAHTLMSTKALNSPEVKKGILRVLLENSGLWEKLRDAG